MTSIGFIAPLFGVGLAWEAYTLWSDEHQTISRAMRELGREWPPNSYDTSFVQLVEQTTDPHAHAQRT
jgi:hypothetical protein